MPKTSNGVNKKFLAIRRREFYSLLQLRTTAVVLSSITLLAAFGFLLKAGGIKAGSEHNVSGFACPENIGWINFAPAWPIPVFKMPLLPLLLAAKN